MKTRRIHIIGVVVFLAILVLLTDSTSPVRAGQNQGTDAAPKSSASTCAQLFKPDNVPTPGVINFDDLDTATLISANYQASYGVVFHDTDITAAYVQEDSTAPSKPNVAENLSIEPYTSANQSMTITFDKAMSAVGMTIGGGNGSTTTATLTAMDVSGVEICHVTYSPVPAGVSAFIGLKDNAGAEIRKIIIDYGKADENEVIDNLLFSNYYVPPIPCAVSWVGYVASVNVGSRAVVTWNVTTNSYYSTQTYLVYDSVSHPQTGTYSGYQVPSPNTGSGKFISGILSRAAGKLFIRPALSYQKTKGAAPVTCQGAEEIVVTVKPLPPPPTPKPGSISGFVTTAMGAGLPGVKVKACLGLICQSGTSKADGAYAIANLSPGDYTLSAALAGYNPFNSRVTVTTSHVTTATITLRLTPIPTPPPNTGTISGHVLEEGTSFPVNAATLNLSPYRGNSSTYFANATSDASGFFTFTNVPVGEWLVLTTKRDYLFLFNVYHVAAGATNTVYIALSRRYHIPTPTPGATLDFSIANVMAFQASQRWDNSLPLAAGRETTLRVFVDLGSSNAADLRSRIYAYLYSPSCMPEFNYNSSLATPLPVSNWNTSNPQRTAVLADPDHTLNFSLPLACTRPGTRHFTVYIPPTNYNPERSFTNNTYEFNLTFQERRPLNVYVVRVSLREFWLCPGSSYPEPPWSAVGPAMQKLVRMYPTVVNILDGGTDDYCASPRKENYYPGWWYINLGLSLRFREFAMLASPDFPLNVPVPMAYGLVDGGECGNGSCAGGQTPMILGYHWVSSGLTTRSTTAAHEVGHARGLVHASNAHNEASGGDWTPWPYLHGAFSQLGPGETWGYEPLAVDDAHPQGVVYAPVSPTFVIPTPPALDDDYVHELMSYGLPLESRWLSDINWNNLFYSFRTPGSLNQVTALPASTTATTRYLLVGGVQNADGTFSIAAMRPVEDPTGALAASLASASPMASGYTLQLKALDGTVLASQPFTPFTLEGDKQAAFQLYIPFPDGVASATILNGTEVVFSRLYSSEAPEVSITAPTASATYDTSVTLNWDASDPDGDPLSFDIDYSPNGGVSWQGVAAMLPDIANSFTVDLQSLPGSENAFFKVTASDGLNTTSAITAAPLVISRKAPTALLTSLPGAARFTTEQVIRLEGTMMDAEDQPPYADAAFVWTSDRDGIIGAGQNTTTFGLTPGRHTITLTVTDSDGLTGSASISIVVDSPFLYLPIIRR